MIPTSYKVKLPRHLSYPVGAEAVSEALAGAPYFESLTLGFSDRAIWPGAEFRRLLRERLPYKLMRAAYRSSNKAGFITSNAMARQGWNDVSWELTVYPVLSELRHLANGLLLEQGLPAVAGWLKSSHRAGWMSRSQQILLEFNPADGTLAILQSSGT